MTMQTHRQTDHTLSTISGASLPERTENEAVSVWRERLYARFRGQPYPLLVFEEGVLPAASMWTGARVWSAAFCEAGLKAGDRIVLALPPSPTFLYVLIASLWNGFTLALLAPGQEVESAVRSLDARASIGGTALFTSWPIDECGLPVAAPVTLRPAQSPPTLDARLLLATSGTTLSPRWIALSDRNLLSVLDSHASPLNLDGARALSTLPWHHAFGLIIDLLPALFAGAEIVRDGRSGRYPEHTLALMNANRITHLNAVPLMVERLLAVLGGDEALRRLQGGVVGGAAVNATLATFLAATRLRAGYGQTEASPGIALGEPGEWEANLLGRPVGCQVRLDDQGALSFAGENACLGVWQEGALTRLPADRWVETGDLARQEGLNLYFVGRTQDSFKLSNGRWIHPANLEKAIHESFPQLRHALIYSPDGINLHLLTTPAGSSSPPDLYAARTCLGLLGEKLQQISEVPLSQWRLTPKGSLQRDQTLQILMNNPLIPYTILRPQDAWPQATQTGTFSTRNPTLTLGPDVRLDCETLERAAQCGTIRGALSSQARQEMESARARFLRRQACGDAIYGTTTGFGPFVRYASAQDGNELHGAGLIAHLSAGWGPPAPAEIVRAAMLLRAQTLAQGWSGVRVSVVEAYLALLERRLVPAVPEIGSVGASGDLIPLAHIARVLTGEGAVLRDERAYSASDALGEAGLEPQELEGRDALALTNGTSFLTAYAALAAARAERLIARAESLTGWAYRLLGCRAAALDPRLHSARGHEGQIQSAQAIAQEAGANGDWEDARRPLQEIYSLRCAPQILGACRENLAFARRLIETEMNGVNDNPLCAPVYSDSCSDRDEAMLHGGNFHGQQVAFAADALNSALTQTALLVERQIEAILNPDINGGAPLLLAWQPGATSGMAGAQITATAIAAEMRTHNQAYATSTLPTNGGNQDIVSMGTLAARMALQQTERLAPILAIAGMSLAQLNYLRERGRAPGNFLPLPAWMPSFSGFEQDRPLQADIARIASVWGRPDE